MSTNANASAPRDSQPDPFLRIVVVDGDDLAAIAEGLLDAHRRGRPVRFVIDDGVKLDGGYGWTPPTGRMADARGR